MADNDKTSNRGFAAMDDERQREIASKGGQSVPDDKRSFSQDRELAAEAGRKGGQASHGGESRDSDSDSDRNRGGSGNFAQDRERAAEAGRKGGEASHRDR